MDKIETISIPEYQLNTTPKPHIEYKIEIISTRQVWYVWKRYNDFHNFHQKLLSLIPSSSNSTDLPVSLQAALPPKTYKFGQLSKEQIEQRRIGLEKYLNQLSEELEQIQLTNGALNLTSYLHDFLQFSQHQKKMTLHSQRKLDADDWLDEIREMETLLSECQTLFSIKERNAQQNDISGPQTVQLKKNLATLNHRLKSLGDALSLPNTIKSLSDGELIRRQNLLLKLVSEKEKLQKQMLTSAQQSRDDLFGSPSNKSSPAMSIRSQKRVFGVYQETEQTKSLDNPQLLQLQNSFIETQDKALDQLLNIVSHQKEIGKAIGEELEKQNQMLNGLDERVELTGTKLKGAMHQAKKLT